VFVLAQPVAVFWPILVLMSLKLKLQKELTQMLA
jgi:hypothetical protein